MKRSHSLPFTLAYAACFVAAAQNSQLVFEASNTQGQSWSPSLTVQPGETVYVRLRIRLANQGTQTVLGLAGITHSPSLSRWSQAVDECLPFTDPIHGVPDEPQTNTGRINPFASSGLGSDPPTLGCYVTGDVLRFRPAPPPPPQTTNLSWGISSGQPPPNTAGTNFRTGTDVVIFRYAVRPGDTGQQRDLIASQILGEILQGRASWYRTDAGTGSLLASVRPEDILPATIHVLPTPGILTPCVLGTFLLTPRRRKP